MTLHISSLTEELSGLPEQNSATMRLLMLLNDPEVESRDVTAVIEADPSMTARLLTLSNSAFFAVRSPVTNPWVAVMVVGFNVVRALAAAGSLGLAKRDGEMPDGFFDHSIASAAGASVIAKKLGLRASDAFSAGLLHDVGNALVFRADRARWEEATVVVDGRRRTDLDAERAVFGAGHDELGAEALDYLHFPDSIIDVVRHHNQPVATIENQLTQVVVAGIALAEFQGAPSTTEPISDPQESMSTLGLEFPPSNDLISELDAEVTELRSLLQ